MTFYDGEGMGGKKRKHHCQASGSTDTDMLTHVSATTLRWHETSLISELTFEEACLNSDTESKNSDTISNFNCSTANTKFP